MINEEVTEQLDIIKINNEVLHYFLILLLLFFRFKLKKKEI